jgi:hypothetical protein
MRTYLDVGVAGIQRYLGRTPDLKGRRGASAWLSHATDRDRLRTWITERPALAEAGVEVNPEAGQADGVAPLRMPVDVDARMVADTVIDELSSRLPGLELRATWGPGPSYVEAYRAWTTASGASATLVSRPANADFPPLETCGKCRVDPALERTQIHEERPWLCADCLARYDERYRGPGLDDGGVAVGAEFALLTRLGRDRRHAVADFKDLAALGDEHGNRNHLATVFADGNAIGALFGRVIAGGDLAAKETVSRVVSEATRGALHAATVAVLDGYDAAAVPVIPHVVGGDDLLVSVVADRAWRFVTEYLREFSQLLAADKGLAAYLGGNGVGPGASAGVVFAHCAFPFRRSVELAEHALQVAKKAHAGRQPAVTWLDVTREGEQAPPHRTAWTLQALDGSNAALTALRAVPATGRAVLERLIDPDDQVLSAARLREQARRLGRDRVLEPFLDGDASVVRIADALALVRWWR